MKPDLDRAPSMPDGPADEATGLPGMPTWRRVYLLVLAVFILYVVLLSVLSKVFA